jgi:hypothetical protein
MMRMSMRTRDANAEWLLLVHKQVAVRVRTYHLKKSSRCSINSLYYAQHAAEHNHSEHTRTHAYTQQHRLSFTALRIRPTTAYPQLYAQLLSSLIKQSWWTLQ